LAKQKGELDQKTIEILELRKGDGLKSVCEEMISRFETDCLQDASKLALV
jgi:hypothetical protein